MGRKALARIGPPEAHYTLPADFAALLGQCVANFGWLEEILKRAIFALDRAKLADDLTPQELQAWATRIGALADDSMGTLIDQFDAAMRRYPGLRDRGQITETLTEMKRHRNLLCHASWRPAEGGRWHPAFVNAKGAVFDHALDLSDLDRIRSDTVRIGHRVVAVMQATGIAGYWAGDDQA